ncbi:unnamed protein product [Ceratitis capitata]|uniref:(Mediterranean fruit fly) hypothetical protein n=1 Tax=Ceratitis capitata TaxID=7213 RepID=A0A811U9K3_CERCA|nr:unnamed protein product [Ceratitis capitata]
MTMLVLNKFARIPFYFGSNSCLHEAISTAATAVTEEIHFLLFDAEALGQASLTAAITTTTKHSAEVFVNTRTYLVSSN